MSIFRDILDTVKDVNNIGNDTLETSLKRKRHSSLAKRSTEGTLQFPVIMTKSLDIDGAQMITKALERQFASFAQIALSMNPFLDMDRDRDAIGYLQRFHQNSGVKTDLFDVMNVGGDLMREGAYELVTNADDTRMMFHTLIKESQTTANVKKDNKRQLFDVMESLNPTIINDKYKPAGSIVSRQQLITEAQNAPRPRNRSTFDAQQNSKAMLLKNKKLQQDIEMDKAKHNLNMELTKSQIDKNQRDSAAQGMNYELPRQMLQSNEVQKSNELVPTTMHIRTILMDAKKQQQGSMDFIIGIKAMMHPVSSEEITSNMVAAVKSKDKIFDFLRWTSGEISFLKDFVLNMKDMKRDIGNRTNGSSPWWIALKRRSAMAKFKNFTMFGRQLLPNATIVLTTEEVDFIRGEFGHDLMDPKLIDKIMKTYFLLGFVIVDNGTQVAHFMFDGQLNYESISFTGLERENKSSGGADLKDVIKLVQRV